MLLLLHENIKMETKKEIAILETALLLLTGAKESDIVLRYDLAPHLMKAKEIVALIRN